ncbi:MAG: peptidyl-prolyl cis-trans isomerase [bacterium]|jgi:hypothetical protein|nr:MAG: hypothetical protein DIU52_05990 [bacterium]
MSRFVAPIVLIATLVVAGCDGLGQAMTAHTDVVARAAGHELTVDEAASLLRLNPRLPAQPEVVEALANLWIDYILLAKVAYEDSTLRSVDVTPLIQRDIDQTIVLKLRDQVIQVDTALTDEELRAIYEREQPGLQVRARHILLRVPPDATPAQRDSVLALARDLQQRAASGADFAALASEYSQDPGSARQGGDLGLFGRGQMVPPFEEAAFALQVGEVSDVVETPFGFHIIKVEERHLPDFEQIKDRFREYAKSTILLEAEEAYVKNLVEPLRIEVHDDAYEVTRELARKPEMKLSPRAAARTLVSYKGGALTAGELQQFMRRFDANQRGAILQFPDERLAEMLRTLAQEEILIQEARRNGHDLTPAERDSLESMGFRRLAAMAAAAGFRTIELREGETEAQAIKRVTNELLEGIVKGERSVLPLGPLGYAMREQYGGTTFERAYPRVVAMVEATRPMDMSQFQPPQPPVQPDGQPSASEGQ